MYQESIVKNHLKAKKGTVTKKQYYLDIMLQVSDTATSADRKKLSFGKFGSRHVKFFFKQIKAMDDDEDEDEGNSF